MKVNSITRCLRCDIQIKPGSVCDQLTQHQREYLSCHSRLATLKRGEAIASEELLVWPILIIMSGALSMQHLLEDGRKIIAALFMQGDIIDTRGIMNRGRGHLVALGTAKMCRFSPKAFEEVLDANLGAQKTAWNNLRDQNTRAMDHAADLTKKQALEKLASFVFECRFRQQRTTSGDQIDIPVRRIDLADYLGMQPETVSRCFRDLEDRGVVSFQGKSTLRVLDNPTLRRIANGDKHTENLRRTNENQLGHHKSG